MCTLQTLIKLPYNRPGEDLNDCLIEDINGTVHVKKSLQNLINLLKKSIRLLEEININIPENNTLDIYGNGVNIGMSGDEKILLNLIKKKLIEEGEFNEESGWSSDDTNSSSDDTSE